MFVPGTVHEELIRPRAPQKVRAWMLQNHPWLEVTPVAQVQPVRGLHKGETEALHLALERKADAVLMDDMDGRAAARRLGIVTIFTLAILELAAEKGFLDLPLAIAKLRQTSFFVSDQILSAALDRDRQRRGKAK